MEPDRKVQDRQRNERPFNRRAFLRSGIIFSGAALTGVGLLHGTETEKKSEEKEAEVGPPEDLMRAGARRLKTRPFNLRRSIATD